MKTVATIFLFIVTFFTFAQDNQMTQEIDQKAALYKSIAQQIWSNPELGYQETASSALLQKTLKDAGFSIKTGVAGIPTAFIAEFGSGAPVIALLAEFDALPGISQQAVAYKAPVVEGGAGHACGHHLFGTASVAAGISIKNWLQKSKTQGTIRVYGTPAEEGGAGKVYMVRAGLFEDVDTVLHWHPNDQNEANASSSLANKSAKFRFYGVASHAAFAPERGRSALDGVEAMNYMTNLLREHVPQETRIHYVITSGGEAPNVVPAFAEVFYYVRNPDVANVKSIFERIVKAAEAAALGTGTEMKYEVIHGLYNLLPNETLSRVMYENLQKVGGIEYTDEERAFAQKIAASFNIETNIEDAAKISPFVVQEKGSGGSTDVGDVSWQVPTAGLGTATWVPGTSAHTWQAVAAGGTSIGQKGMLNAAKVIALTAAELYKNPAIIQKAKEELATRRGNNTAYEALIGDREPPLDYRN
jgi:aminobenzoyl-glutamate utilization protein B